MNASSGSGLWPEADQHGSAGQVPRWRRTPWTAWTRTGSEPLSESIQDYLKAIYQLAGRASRVPVTALARAQEVSPASASAMVKKLAALGLADTRRTAASAHAGGRAGRARGDPPPPAARALPRADARRCSSTPSTTRPTGSSTCSRTSWRRASTRRSASRRTTRTGTRSPTRTSSGPRSASERPKNQRSSGQQLLAHERRTASRRRRPARDDRVVLERLVRRSSASSSS